MNTAKAENESAMERLRTDIAQRDKFFLVSLYSVAIAIVTLLGSLVIFGGGGRYPAPPPAPVPAAAPAPAPAPIIIYLPAGAQAPVVQGGEAQVLPLPAQPPAALPSQPGETAGK